MKPYPIAGGEYKYFYSSREKLEEKVKYSSFTNKRENEKNVKKMVLVASTIGALAPIVISNIKKGKGKEFIDTFKKTSTLKDKIKSSANLLEVKTFSQILFSTLGGITAGVFTGIKTDKNKENKDSKYKEGIFEFLNSMTPTIFVAGGENLIGKYEEKLKMGATKLSDSADKKIKLMRAGLVIGSVVGGMFIANKTSNKINKKCFKKENEKKEKRDFRICDCFVHLDDLIGLFVLSKSPALNQIANKIQMDKVLPFLYARTGYEAGSSTKCEFEKRCCSKQ